MKRRLMAAALALFTVFALLPMGETKADVTVTLGEIVGDRVAVRKKPDAGSNSLTRLDNGAIVEILESNVNAEWFKVKTGKHTGYVNRLFVNIGPSLESYQVTSGTGVIINCNKFINVRAAADSTSKKLGELKKDAEVSVTKANVSAGWHEIEYNGQTAYVASKYVALSVKCEDTQLSAIEVKGGTLSPAFSPSEYGYILTATEGEVTVSAKANDGVKVSVGSTGVASAKYTINSGNSKTIRISVGGKVRYTIYLVRDVVTVGTWNIKRGNDSLLMQAWLIGNQRADIMGIQEVYVSDNNNVNNLLSLRTSNMKNWSFAPTIDYDSGKYGVGTISAYDIVSTDQYELPKGTSKEPRTLQKTVYHIGDKTVSVYNTHFSYESSSIRAKQFAEVLKIMNADENSYRILMGDFNAGESEFAEFRGTYRMVNNSATKFYDYSGKRVSMSQIDNILVTKNITVLNARTIPNDYSDHYPLIAFLKFK